MGKWTLGILSEDQEYITSLQAFYRGGYASGLFELVGFSQRETLKDHLAVTGKLDILLIDEHLNQAMDELLPEVPVSLVLREFESVEPDQALSSIQKYQPLDQLTAKLISMCLDLGTVRTPLHKQGHGKLISVYSAAGGTGKTTVACNAARVLAFYGYRVFLLPLETFQSPLPFQSPANEDSYAKLLYYLKSDPARIPYRIQVLRSTDQLTGLDYMEPHPHVGEIDKLTGPDTSTLIEGILSCGYDFVVLDLDSSLQERTIEAIRESDLLLCVVTDDKGCLIRTERAIGEMERTWREAAKRSGYTERSLMEKTRFILNRFTGAFANHLYQFELPQHQIHQLPYIPGWKSISSMEQLLAEPVIQDTLAGIIGSYFADWDEHQLQEKSLV